MAEAKLSIKLLIDKNEKRVLFGEAGKDCVDFLFFILSLPLSTLIRLLGKQRMVGALPNLYESIEKMNESYFQQHITKATLLQPATPLPGYSVPFLSIQTPTQDNKFYRCSKLQTCYDQYGNVIRSKTFSAGHDYVSDDPRATCPSCKAAMDTMVTYVAAPGAVQLRTSGRGGFVKEVVTYMVMDDLTVKPMSTISSIALLNQFNINNVSALEEKVVNFGINEAVKLLKASLVSKKVLTNVFLNGDI